MADVQRQSLAFAGRRLSFSRGIGDLWQWEILRSVGCSGAVRLGGVVPQLRILSQIHEGSAAFWAVRGGVHILVVTPHYTFEEV